MSEGEAHTLILAPDRADAEKAIESLGLSAERTEVVASEEEAAQALAAGRIGAILVCLHDGDDVPIGLLDHLASVAPSNMRIYLLGAGGAGSGQMPWQRLGSASADDALPAAHAQVFERLLRAESCRALENLARGIAAQLADTLGPILADAEALLEHDLGEQAQTLIQEVLDQGEEAKLLVGRLEALATTPSGKKNDLVDINVLLRDIVDASEPWWRDELKREGRSINVEFALNPLPRIHGDLAGLRQALLQLLTNAIEAISESGRVAIRTESSGGQVRILFTDTGPGVPKDLQRVMFQPFVTGGEAQSAYPCRKVSLGLSMVEGIVSSHGGGVEVFSQEKGGTTIVVSLPVLSREQLHPSVPPPRPTEPTLPARDILVIEAEDEVRDLLARVLTEEGQRVTAVSDTPAGLACFLRKRQDVVLTDWGADGVAGLEVAQRIKEASPSTRVYLLTGLTSQMDEAEAIHWSVDGFVPIPLTGAQLRARLPALLKL